jgi:ubiquinone/menaquinone biosynthesis C-methylase UbiE
MPRPHAPGFAQRAMESEAVVRVYESRLWRRSLLTRLVLGLSFEREQALIQSAAQLAPAARVLDLACGSGLYARRFARDLAGGRVVGLDLSPAMLRHAQRSAAAEDLDDLRLVRGDATRLPFPSECFDHVNCCGALHLFPDPARALAEMHRVLRRGGHLTLAVVRRPDGPLAPLAPLLLRLGVESFRCADLEALLARAGFDAVRWHHARALWAVVSARRPGRPRGGGTDGE